MTFKVFFLVLVAEACSAGMHILFKRGVNTLEPGSMRSIKGYLRFVRSVLKNPSVWAGLLVVCCGMVVWLLVLAHAELSLAFPLDSIQYVFILLASAALLGERVNRYRILGTFFIIAGIVLVALQ
ncbi:MAG: EamA family transporter [Desulfobacterota bacterium]|nr:EamA family transporter [Thermodesulfobacteriota bacterium]